MLKALQDKHNTYLELIKSAQDCHGFIDSEHCDSLLFSGLVGSVPGVRLDIDAAFDPADTCDNSIRNWWYYLYVDGVLIDRLREFSSIATAQKQTITFNTMAQAAPGVHLVQLYWNSDGTNQIVAINDRRSVWVKEF